MTQEINMESKKRSKSKIAVGLILGMTIPLTIAANVYENEVHAYVFGSVGSNWYSSGYSASLGVGQGNALYADNAAAVGTSLVVYDPNSLVVGKWNKDLAGNLIFVVANGNGTPSDPEEKLNLFEIHETGDVVIHKAQGDISMGTYAP